MSLSLPVNHRGYCYLHSSPPPHYCCLWTLAMYASYILHNFSPFNTPIIWALLFISIFQWNVDIKILPWLRNVNIYKVTKLMSGWPKDRAYFSLSSKALLKPPQLSLRNPQGSECPSSLSGIGLWKHSGLKDLSQNHKLPAISTLW